MANSYPLGQQLLRQNNVTVTSPNSHINNFTQVQTFNNTSFIQPIQPVNPIHTKLGDLFNDSTTSDIEFLIGEQSIHAHRQYLSMMSPYLAGRLSEHWQADQKQVKIDQYGYSTFHAYIRYLYTGLVSVKCMNTSELVELLDLATAFVEELVRQECIKEMHFKMCIEHGCITYQIADRYDLVVLKVAAAKFIRTNLRAVARTEAYKELNTEICKKLLTSMAECE